MRSVLKQLSAFFRVVLSISSGGAGDTPVQPLSSGERFSSSPFAGAMEAVSGAQGDCWPRAVLGGIQRRTGNPSATAATERSGGGKTSRLLPGVLLPVRRAGPGPREAETGAVCGRLRSRPCHLLGLFHNLVKTCREVACPCCHWTVVAG